MFGLGRWKRVQRGSLYRTAEFNSAGVLPKFSFEKEVILV